MARTKYTNVAKAEKYARDVVAGKIIACKWIKLACQRHLDDKKASRSKDFPYKFDPAKAEKIAKFIQLLPHTKGKWAQKQLKIKLEPWQLFSICIPFGWVKKKDGLRRYTRMIIFVPRKNGKSIIAAGIGLYMFVADDEFGAEVYSGATTEKQAWEVFRPAKQMVDRTPALKDHYGVESNASNLNVALDGSRFEPIIGKPGDGSSPSCALIDEYHEHKDSDLYDTMETGMGSREQPMMVVITTAGSGIGGPCYLLVRDAQKMLEGVLDMPDLWAMIYTKDEEDDWTSDIALRKANPNYDISVGGEFLANRSRDAQQSARKQNTFRTKHVNEFVGAKTAWMNMSKWNQAPERLSLEELQGRPCYIGLDLATKIDVVAKVMVFPPYGGDPNYHVHGKYYIPEARLYEEGEVNSERYQEWDEEGLLTVMDGEVVDFSMIEDDIAEDMKTHDVREVAYDPWQAAQLAQNLSNDGVTMVEIRHTVQNISEPMKENEALVLSQRWAHGGCPIMTWMMSNVVAKLDAKDNIYPNKERAENKIDGPVAGIMALARAIVHNDDDGSLDDFLQDPIIA
ncbi:terminase large subunit [Psychrobacter sp. 2Y5]|uniref:terminase large subunit n=1 Tax=unclassified Psychrobacter TaxID=196806 RepID=UPI003F45585A